MSTLQSKPLRRIARVAGAPLMCLLIATGLFVPTAGTAGVTPGESDDVTVVPAPDKEVPRPSYQVRCWQFGRLLFEENNVSLNLDGGPYTPKLQGTDGKGGPVYVAETKNATCLIKPVASERSWPR
jgi:hypothetical protein